MPNPWNNLPASTPFVLESDKAAIERFNGVAKPEHRFHLEILPEPFLGAPGAPIVLLNLNPGYSPHDLETHKNGEFYQAGRAALTHAHPGYPFHLLDPQFSEISEGYRWWRKRLNQPILRWGVEEVAGRFLCVEFFPYHSKKWAANTPRVDSQKYSFDLVRQAIARDALIIVMRGEPLWVNAVPELAAAPNRYYRLNSNQNVAISPGNMTPEAWRKLDEKMKV